MKKLFQTILVIFSSLNANSQTNYLFTPDVLPPATMGSYYDQILSFTVPYTAIMDPSLFGLPANVTGSSATEITVSEVTFTDSLPAGLSAVFDVASGTYSAGQSGTLHIYGIPTSQFNSSIKIKSLTSGTMVAQNQTITFPGIISPGGFEIPAPPKVFDQVIPFDSASNVLCSSSFNLAPNPSTPNHWFLVPSASITGVPPITYIFDWGDGSSSTITNPDIYHTYDSAGYYTICLTINDNAGCSATYCDSSTYLYKTDASMVTLQVVNELPNSISKIEEDGNVFNCFPNPSSGTIQFELSQKNTQSVNIRIKDLLGREVLGFKNIAPKGTMELPNLHGLYILEAEAGGNTVVGKVVVR